MRLKGKVAVITGAGSGLGRAAAIRFADEGASVIVADYNAEAAEETVWEIIDRGGLATYTKVDVSKMDSVKAMVNLYDRIDILINNAGITRDARLSKMTEQEFDVVIGVNLKGVYNCTRAVVEGMLNRGYGRIINTSSIVGRFGNFGQTNYAAAKAGVIGMTQTWARELGAKGITVNAVAPGFIQTPMTDAMPQNVLDMMAGKVPLKRLGVPDDIANTYLFLASDEASYINGAVIPVDGGLVI